MASVPHRRMWRIWLLVAVFATCASGVWQVLFPHTFWFFKMWCGFATGAVVGLLVGAWWQLSNHQRYGATSGRVVVGAFAMWVVLAALALLLLAPQMRAEEALRADIRGLSEERLAAVDVQRSSFRTSVMDAAALNRFAEMAQDADLFYPSHEASLADYTVSLRFRNGQVVTFDAYVPERHQQDLCLRHLGHLFHSEVLLPDGRAWIDSQLATSPGRQGVRP